MSKLIDYSNPLDSFRTYSYHFVLTAGSSTETFRKMIGGGGKSLMTAIQSKKLGEEFDIEGNKGYLVVDTRRFSQYSITDIEMDHIYGTGERNNPTVPSSIMKMRLIDTTGLSFFSFMMDLFRNKLKTSRLSAFFMLSIIFTGHRADGTTETISICNIPLILLLMGFTFNQNGSEYEIEFMETEGAPQRGGPTQLINSLASVRAINAKDTLGNMIDALESSLNKQSLEYYQKYVNTAVSKGESLTNVGKLVQYMITIPDEWARFTADLAQPSANGKQISFSSTDVITDAIKKILEKSTEFLKLAGTDKVKNGEGKAFKTVTSITSGQSTYLIHFDIYPYAMPKSKREPGKVAPGNGAVNIDVKDTRNVLTYNYIFTGKNSHIEDLKIQYNPESAVALDINLDIGPSRFMNNAEAGQTKTSVKESSAGAATKSLDFSPLLRPGDPIFPVKTQNQLNNGASQYTDYKDAKEARDSLQSKQEYDKNYAILHFLSSISMDMTIRGNPKIIEKFADRSERGGIPQHFDVISGDQLKEIAGGNNVNTVFNSIQSSLSSYKLSYKSSYVKPRIKATEKINNSNDALKNGLDVSTYPLFVRLDIRAPDVDWAGNFLDTSRPYSNKFFFDGDYTVLFVKTTFSGGRFSHIFTMIPYDVDGAYTLSNDSASSR
jgi:hypothetical protein